MQKQGSPFFLRYHQGSVRAVSFSPRDRYLFCSGAYDGKVNLYTAQHMELLMCYQVSSVAMVRNINAVRFTSDGSRILAATAARRLAVIDVERGEQVMTYDNCAFDTRERASLAADPICPNMAVCSSANGRGLTLFDLRMPLPLDFVYDLHDHVIRDLLFLHSSWPFVRSHQSTVLSLAVDGVCKVTTLDGRYLHSFEVGHKSHSVAATPEAYGSEVDNGFRSVLLVGGDTVSGYVPDLGVQEKLREHGENSVWKMRYTSNGSLLYTACDRGIVRRYRRYPDHHKFLNEVLRHKENIHDMDLSPYDDYLITASKDRSVGVLQLGLVPPTDGQSTARSADDG
uniref:Putative wd40 domain protein n=1 Tax=Amblyomma triste TaxID=251400 RepID=A0A023G8I9_AMBTT